MEKALQRGMCFTRYLIERDCLTASMTRLGNGFMPPSAILEAKHHLTKIQTLVKEMEEIALKKDKDLPLSSNRLE